jgi:hypothetical protein
MGRYCVALALLAAVLFVLGAPVGWLLPFALVLAWWGGVTWSGDGPTGHHREGTLRFAAGGPASGAAALSLSGLRAPVTATWTIAG